MSTLSPETIKLLDKFSPTTNQEERTALAAAMKITKTKVAEVISTVSGTSEHLLMNLSTKNKSEMRTMIISTMAVSISHILAALLDMLRMENVAAETILRDQIITNLKESK